ncbi:MULTISPECIES: MarR family transcriptional regulator [Micromonospora]|uniref:MarR family transcriptional regulator n=1 Tax=Micromonospora TaxID=1873 RepID=UPI001E37EE3B|nr:MarR family transcriptional regulator [Micromonospora yangpuensis]
MDDAAGTLLAVWEAALQRPVARLSSAQLRAVMVVEQHDGINLRRLASELQMLLSSASRLCDRLEAAGMLEREPGRSDRREISLHLTREARRLLDELQADRRQRLAEVLARMSPAGRQALLRGMVEFDQVSRDPSADSGAGPDRGPDDDPQEPTATGQTHERDRPAGDEPPSGRLSREIRPDRWRAGDDSPPWPSLVADPTAPDGPPVARSA